MSCQQLPPWSRRNASPKQQSRPVRATLPVALMKQQSPTKSKCQQEENLANNANQQCEHAEALAVERPTLFLGPRGEKSKTLNLRSQPSQHHMRRTSSLDTLFLASHGPAEASIYVGHFMVDRATQTPDEWKDDEFDSAQWKSMVTAGEQLEVKFIRQKLQRTNNNRTSGLLLCSQRQSPIHGDHTAVSNIDTHSHPGAFVHKPSLKTSVLPASSRPIPITQVPRQRQGSFEALNQEVEKLVLQDVTDESGASSRVFEPTPDGHRAPIAELFHSIKSSSSDNSSRSHSTSPEISNSPENSVSPVSDECKYKLGSSPHINKFLSREPPDGCEKVKVFGDPRQSPVYDFPLEKAILKPEFSFVLQPSQSSAFCPLYKNMKNQNPSYESTDVIPPFSKFKP